MRNHAHGTMSDSQEALNIRNYSNFVWCVRLATIYQALLMLLHIKGNGKRRINSNEKVTAQRKAQTT